MKAVVCTRYGGPEFLEFQERPMPEAKADELLVKVVAASITSADWRVRGLQMPRGFGGLARLIFGFSKPRQPILGNECAGVVEAVGSTVSGFRIGDQVMISTGAKFGCHAEYITVKADQKVALKPPHLSFTEAATLTFGAAAAWDFLINKAKLQSGERVLVHGATGSVGAAAVKISKHFGAEVTAVCSGLNRDWVLSQGADHHLDYQNPQWRDGGQTFDVILDAVGNVHYAMLKHLLAPRGRILLITADLPELLRVPFLQMRNPAGHRIYAGPISDERAVFHQVVQWASLHHYRPAIDRVFPFTEIREAHLLAEKRHKRGNVAIAVSPT